MGFCPCCNLHVHVFISHHKTLSAFTRNDGSPSAKTHSCLLLCWTPCWSTTLNKICTYCFERALYWCRFPSPEYSLPHMCNSQNPPALHCRSELWSFSFKKKTHRKESRIPLYTWKMEKLSRKKPQYKLSSINRDGREPIWHSENPSVLVCYKGASHWCSTATGGSFFLWKHEHWINEVKQNLLYPLIIYLWCLFCRSFQANHIQCLYLSEIIYSLSCHSKPLYFLCNPKSRYF